jgi:hypothetical protein
MQTKRSPVLRRSLGLLGLLTIFSASFLLAAGAASRPASTVPAAHGGFPGWLSGPLGNLGVDLGKNGFQLLLIAMAVGYGMVLLTVRALPSRTVWLTIIAAHLALLAGPVLFSQDLFGYLSYARLGALHGLDPYTHTSAAAPGDGVYRFLGWHGVSSPYGPLFTLGTYALVPLGVAGGVWGLKTLAVAGSLGAVALLARSASVISARGTAPVMAADDSRTRIGAASTRAAAFVGLNPVLLAFAVGGGHNDTLILALLAGALLASAAGADLPGRAASHTLDGGATATPGAPGSTSRQRSAIGLLAVATAVKLSAGLALPFLLLSPARWRERLGLLRVAVIALAAVAVIGVLGFGTHALGFLGAVRGEQQLIAVHSVPAELARLVGLHGTPGWWRSSFAVLFVVVLVGALWRTIRGADWRLMAGWSTLVLLLCTAWLLPWYAIWSLPFAAVGEDRRLRAAALAFCAYALLTRLPFAAPVLSP